MSSPIPATGTISSEFWYENRTMQVSDDRRVFKQHQDDVRTLSQAIRQFYASRTPFHVHHGPPCDLRKPTPKTKRVDISHLNRVVHVNPMTRTVLAEPGVIMADLLTASLYHGLMPAVVLEFPGITCGSAFATTSTSSASFRSGLFEDIVTSIEVILGNGDIVTKARPAGDQSDLFWGCASGLGSMGVVTMMEIQLVPAMPYVQLSYFVCNSLDEASRTMERETAPCIAPRSSLHEQRRKSYHSSLSRHSDDDFDQRPDFADAIAFSPCKAVVMVGRQISAPDEGTLIRRFSQNSDPYFYSHVSAIADSAPSTSRSNVPESPSSIQHPAKPNKVDSVALPDYFFRYDRGVFFAGGDKMAKHAHPHRPILRAITSRYLRSSRAIGACRRSGLDSVTTSFTASVPSDSIPSSVLELGQDLGVWPIWLCPTRKSALPAEETRRRFSVGSKARIGSISPRQGTSTMVTIGCFGLGKAGVGQQEAALRAARNTVEEAGGTVTLLGCPLNDEQEIWERFDRQWYEEVRKKYAAERLPSLAERVGMAGDNRVQEKPLWMLKASAVVIAVCNSE
ncbi:FAD-binding protein [Zalerion maritima]|uniref:Delta(24)-sterol reductase n=1 Tax=Zalerion maritima TaxID=339359 RepID=A0AAD5RM77_9PEZI|nr:FAD-binding protein [Zalerion maritima]